MSICPQANRTCFNVTITVKTSFHLVTMDKGLFNHTRLLHSVVCNHRPIIQLHHSVGCLLRANTTFWNSP